MSSPREIINLESQELSYMAADLAYNVETRKKNHTIITE